MKKITTFVTLAVLAAAPIAPRIALATQNEIVMTDHSMRASKIIGATVYNDQGQSIGSVVDVLVRNEAAEPTAILSIGDFVGGGTKLIAVPLSHVNLDGAKATMAGATKQMLTSMPAYQFKPSENNGRG